MWGDFYSKFEASLNLGGAFALVGKYLEFWLRQILFKTRLHIHKVCSLAF